MNFISKRHMRPVLEANDVVIPKRWTVKQALELRTEKTRVNPSKPFKLARGVTRKMLLDALANTVGHWTSLHKQKKLYLAAVLNEINPNHIFLSENAPCQAELAVKTWEDSRDLQNFLEKTDPIRKKFIKILRTINKLNFLSKFY